MIKRKIYHELEKHLSEKEITFIVGPRQAGKTTLMNALREKLDRSGEKTLYLNMDIERDRRHFASQDNLITKIKTEIGSNKGFVFLDEVQRKENVGLFLKGIYDMNLPYKFIVSGSGSIELKAKINESMVGRKRMFELSTLTFVELINFKTSYKYEDRLQQFFSVEPLQIQKLLEEYLNFGGYPKVVLLDIAYEKIKAMEEIFEGYIEKDIGYLLGVENTNAFSSLVKILSSQIGNLVNIAELSSTLGTSAPTINKYLWYLENTYILQRVNPFFRNVRKEITKSPIFYFYDLGFRNFARETFGQDQKESPEIGFLFENFVHNLINETIESPTKIHFWRTKDKAEVDLIVERGLMSIPVEVKYKNIEKPEIPRSLRSFLLKYRPENAYIIHLGKESQFKIDNTTVHLLPFYKLIGKESAIW